MAVQTTLVARGAEPRRRPVVAVWLLVAACVMGATVAGCGASSSPGTYVGDEAVAVVGAQLEEEGRVAYYFGPDAAGLALTHIERVTHNGPDFQVFAAYGTCRSGAFEEAARGRA